MPTRVETRELPQEPSVNLKELSGQLKMVLKGSLVLNSQHITDSLIHLKRMIEFSRSALIAGTETIPFSTSTLQLPNLIRKILETRAVTSTVAEIEIRELRTAVDQIPVWLMESSNERVADNNDYARYSEKKLIVSVDNIISILEFILTTSFNYDADSQLSEFRKVESFAISVLRSAGNTITDWRDYLRHASRVNEVEQLSPLFILLHNVNDLLIEFGNQELEIQVSIDRAQQLLQIAREQSTTIRSLHLTGARKNLLTTTELHPELSELLIQFRDLVSEFDEAKKYKDERKQLECLTRAITFYDARLRSYMLTAANIDKKDPTTGAALKKAKDDYDRLSKVVDGLFIKTK